MERTAAAPPIRSRALPRTLEPTHGIFVFIMSRPRILASLFLALAVAGGIAVWMLLPDPGTPDGGASESASTGAPTFARTDIPPPAPEDVEAVSTLLSGPIEPSAVFDEVSELAESLAALPHVPDTASLPPALTAVGYDGYRAIEFRPEAAVWRDHSPFELQLFHPGFLYTRPVRIHLIEDETVRELAFDTDRFEYGDTAGAVFESAASAASGIGHAGFRVHYPLNDPASKDEIVVFLGASYFRMLGPGQVHGLSSRALAVNVAEETPEEFPYFRAFWVERPDPDASSMVFHGLLDSPSVTGAYRFELVPGEDTALRVTARLYARTDVSELGIAPLTSMFLHGPDDVRRFDDYRTRVHDSNGLLMRTSWDEWIWRPLSNPSVVRVTSLRDTHPRGFGLAQRARDFDDYLDLEARYDRRPSEWVSTEGEWGAGGVELVELPTPSEFNDNIVAYWAPDEPLLAGQEREYRYTLTTFAARLAAQTLGQVARTRSGHDALPGQGDAPPVDVRRFVIDFRGGVLAEPLEADSIGSVLVTSSGQVSEPILQALPTGDGWRASFRLVPEGNDPADMQLFLEVPGRRVTETWSYVWYPERIRP